MNQNPLSDILNRKPRTVLEQMLGKLYDGGQIYGLRELKDFQDVYDHRKNVTKNQDWVGSIARNKWNQVGFSFVSMNYE